jgi:hypothetical protein
VEQPALAQLRIVQVLDHQIDISAFERAKRARPVFDTIAAVVPNLFKGWRWQGVQKVHGAEFASTAQQACRMSSLRSAVGRWSGSPAYPLNARACVQFQTKMRSLSSAQQRRTAWHGGSEIAKEEQALSTKRVIGQRPEDFH